jgi:hypothetical protein
MSQQRALFLHKSLIGTGALVALVLLVSFYAVVHGAVDRARQRATAFSSQTATATVAPRSQGTGLLARAGN